MIKIRHSSPVLISLVIVVLLAPVMALAGGVSSAQEQTPLDDIISSALELALQQGGFIRPGDTLSRVIPEHPHDVRLVDLLDGFIIYLGNRSDISLDQDYVVEVTSDFADPKILVATYFDTAKLGHYAYHFGYNLASFVNAIGLESERHQVTIVPAGTVIAVNERGANTLRFRPVEGDVGAYLIVISTFDRKSHGPFSITVSAAN